jgi:hypothetical protein
MKYLLTLSIVFALAVTGQSQWWFDAGVSGAWGSTGIIDDNVYDHGSYKQKLSSGTSFGGRLGINYGYHVGLIVEYAGSSSDQQYNYSGESPFNTFSWKHNDLTTLFRYSGNGAYVEFGAKFSSINEVELENVSWPTADVTENFADNYTSGVFGFGSYLMGSELLTINLGVRVHWAFGDMVNETGKASYYPIVTSQPNNPKPNTWDPSVKSHAAAVQLRLEVNYAFGHFAKEGCHDRWKLILFQ